VDYPVTVVTSYHAAAQAGWIDMQTNKKGYQFKVGSLVPAKV